MFYYMYVERSFSLRRKLILKLQDNNINASKVMRYTEVFCHEWKNKGQTNIWREQKQRALRTFSTWWQGAGMGYVTQKTKGSDISLTAFVWWNNTFWRKKMLLLNVTLHENGWTLVCFSESNKCQVTFRVDQPTYTRNFKRTTNTSDI